MKGLLIASTTPKAGKNLLCFSLGSLLRQKGFSVGYCKPLGAKAQLVDERYGDSDALIVQELLGLSQPANILSPVILPQSLSAFVAEGTHQDNLSLIGKAYSRLSQKKDITLVSGTAAFPHTGRALGVDGLSLVSRLDLSVLLVESFTQQTRPDSILCAKDALGDKLLGVILNNIAEEHMREAQELYAPWLTRYGIPVLGSIPHEPLLNTIRPQELAIGLGGRMVVGSGGAQHRVEGFLIGTMQVDNFLGYLRQQPHSAIIVGGDRSDLQILALHAECPCLVLTGNIGPCELIRSKAQTMGIPVIVVREDTYTVARKMENILSGQKVWDLDIVRRGTALVCAAIDHTIILKTLGLKQPEGENNESDTP